MASAFGYSSSFKSPSFGRVIVLLVAFGLLVAALCGCGATQKGEKPLVASMVVANPAGGAPIALARYDLNGLVAWGVTKAELEVYLRGSGIPILGPLYIDEHKAVVKINEPKFEWTGALGGPLPHQCRSWFRQGEITAWGLHFDDEVMAAAPVPDPESGP
jgi:hypothetical protein